MIHHNKKKKGKYVAYRILANCNFISSEDKPYEQLYHEVKNTQAPKIKTSSLGKHLGMAALVGAGVGTAHGIYKGVKLGKHIEREVDQNPKKYKNKDGSWNKEAVKPLVNDVKRRQNFFTGQIK